MLKRHKFSEDGKCPKCGSDDINYGVLEPDGTGAYYPADCESCKYHFRVYYNMTFAGHYGEEGDEE